MWFETQGMAMALYNYRINREKELIALLKLMQ